MTLVLCGFKRCGKTFWGKRLAEFLSIPFVDTDELLEEKYFHQRGERLDCADIYRHLGHLWFRQLEHQVITELKEKKLGIIATGGGCFRYAANILTLKHIGRLVYLKRDHVLERILEGPLPAYVEGHRPIPFLQKMIEDLSPLFESVCEFQIALDQHSEEEILRLLANYYKRRKRRGK